MQAKRTIRQDLLDTGALAVRFWTKVRVGAPSDCWPFLGCKTHFGHGHFHISGHTLFAHRVAWALDHGINVPPGLYVLHRCDNPACVNPAHLSLGSHADNMQDMWDRRRHAPPDRKGAASHRAKLTEDEVAEIRRLAMTGLTQQQIAWQFGVTQTNVGQIIHRRTWNDGRPGTKPLRPGRVHGEAHPSARLTANDVLAIREVAAAGTQLTALAARYGVTKESVWAVVHRKTWKHV